MDQPGPPPQIPGATGFEQNAEFLPTPSTQQCHCFCVCPLLTSAVARVSCPLQVVALNLKTLVNQRDKVNEIAAASVLYCREVRADGPMSQSEWNTSQQMRHFSVVRKLDGSVFPVGWDDVVKQVRRWPSSVLCRLKS